MSELKRVPLIGVVADPQSYLNIVYLLLGLPLGIGSSKTKSFWCSRILHRIRQADQDSLFGTVFRLT